MEELCERSVVPSYALELSQNAIATRFTHGGALLMNLAHAELQALRQCQAIGRIFEK
jgi:hypothetical protein